MSHIKLLLENLDNVFSYGMELPIPKLVGLLKALSKVYYGPGYGATSSPVSDDVFDMLRDILEKRDPNNKFLKSTGHPIKHSHIKVPLPFKMPSLLKIKPTNNSLTLFTSSYPGPYVISDKLDGASALYYKGKLYSRGDGSEGQDISYLLPYLNIPETDMAIRGEIVISKTNFEHLSGIFKDARAAVNSHMTNNVVNESLAKLTDFVAYSITYPRFSAIDQFKKLKTMDIITVNHSILKEITKESLSTHLIDRRDKSPYNIDGIVLTDSSTIYPLPDINRPKYSLAFKAVLTDQIAETIVLQVIWNPSKHGYLKPTIRIDPVEINGFTYEYVTAKNAKYVNENNIGPGSKIKVIRSGDVIINIHEILSPSFTGKAGLPQVPYKWNESGVDLIVKDIHGACEDNINVKRIYNFFKTCGISDVGEGVIKTLVDEGYNSIELVLDAFTNKRDELGQIYGLGDKIVEKIHQNINKGGFDLVNIMAGSTIFGRGFGEKKIRMILEHYPKILEEEISVEGIIELDGFSNKTATQFIKYLDEFKEFYNRIKKYYRIGSLSPYKTPINSNSSSSPLSGKKIVFTGFRNKQLENYLTNLGAKITTTVSSSTGLVIYTDTTAKYKMAVKLAVETITLDEFKKKYNINL